MEILNDYILVNETRYETLRLLATFLEQQVPHLHIVQDTPIIDNLLRCLLIDKSTPVIASALAVLMMFMPHIPNVIALHLPQLFLVYSRVLCWDTTDISAGIDKLPTTEEKSGEVSSSRNPELLIDKTWQRVYTDEVHKVTEMPNEGVYFTLLYGLFPLNFTSFINKPRTYLKNASYPGQEDMDFGKPIMRSRSEMLRQSHFLHPNFLRTTIEEELTENRWTRMEASEVLLECLQLSTNFRAAGIEFSDAGSSSFLTATSHEASDNRDSDGQLSLRSSTTDLNAQKADYNNEDAEEVAVPVTRAGNHNVNDSAHTPVFSARLLRSSGVNPAYRQVEDNQVKSQSLGKIERSPSNASLLTRTSSTKNLNVAATTGSRSQEKSTNMPSALSRLQMSNRTVSAPISHNDSLCDDAGDGAQDEAERLKALNQELSLHERAISSLCQEVNLLRNDISFERYLREQHSVYISQLRRKNNDELRLVAETQNLVEENKNLKSKLAKVNENLAQLRRETATSRNQAKRLEGVLSTKLRSFQDENADLKKNSCILDAELAEMKLEYKKLLKLLEDRDFSEQTALHRLEHCQSELSKFKCYPEENERLRLRIAQYERAEMRNRVVQSQLAQLEIKLDYAEKQIRDWEFDSEQMRQKYESKISDLERKLEISKLEESKKGQKQSLALLSVEQEKREVLRKDNERLRRKCFDLGKRLMVSEGHREADLGRLAKLSEKADGKDSTGTGERNAEVVVGKPAYVDKK